MQGFEDVTLSWQGEDYTVPANNVLMLIMRIEDALSGNSGEQAINVLLRNGGPPHSRLSAAFGAALRHAGAQVSDAEIYLSIQRDMASGGSAAMEVVTSSVIALLGIMSPPLAAQVAGGDDGKKTKAAKA